MSSSDEKSAREAAASPHYASGAPVPPELSSNMGIGRYLATRLPSLKPPMNRSPNPIKLLMLLNRKQWIFFLVGFLGWTVDSIDFFSVSLTVSDLAKQFDVSTAAITWGITCKFFFLFLESFEISKANGETLVVLMLRSVGAILFGIASGK